MALVIPDFYANWILTISNAVGGASGRNSVAIGMHHSSPLTQGDVGRIANLLRDGLTPRYDPSWSLGPTHVLETSGGVHKVWDDTGTEAGTHANIDYAPPAVALVVSKQTGLAGRAFRGRLYFPGVEEASVDEAGIVAGAFVNAWQAAMDALQTALIADAAVDNLFLFHDEGTPGALAPNVITSFRVRNVVGGMRPRQRR